MVDVCRAFTYKTNPKQYVSSIKYIHIRVRPTNYAIVLSV